MHVLDMVYVLQKILVYVVLVIREGIVQKKLNVLENRSMIQLSVQ